MSDQQQLSMLEVLKSSIANFKKYHSFMVETKTVGKKEFETYLVKQLPKTAEPTILPPAQNFIRVTHPLGYWVPPAFKAWLQNNTASAAQKKMETAGTEGSEIHKIIEDCKGDVSQLPLNFRNEKIKNGVDAFRSFWNEQGFTILAQELKVFSRKYGIAGTIDLVAEKDGQIYILDWKSGGYRASHGWQLAAYGMMFTELFGCDVKLVAVMLDKRSGKASKIAYEHNSHLEACYLGVLQAFAGENWKALAEFWPWNLTHFHNVERNA